MAKKTLDVNTDAVVGFSNILDQLGRSALPSAIRGAINKAVFDVKTKTMPMSAAKNFEKRSPNFFKANSRFKNAKGFDIDKMKGTVGFVENRLKGSNNFAIEDLVQQESGGTIKGKAFIPTSLARVSKNKNKKVRANSRLGSIKNLIDSRRMSGKTRQARFLQAAARAGTGGHVLGDIGSGKMILWRVNSLQRTSAGSFKLTALYSFKPNRTVRVKKTNFMHDASLTSGKKIETFYKLEARRQIRKFENK